MENNTTPINTISLKNEILTDTNFTFFDRIEGSLYPGELVSMRKESTNMDPTEMVTVGYESAFVNPMRNFGEFIQSSGKLRLETFKTSNNKPDGSIDIGFEFMNADSKTYKVNEMIIWWSYSIGDRRVEFKSPTLKLIGGIKNQTRVTISEYGIKYHHTPMFDTLLKDLRNLDKGGHIDLIVEVYIK